MATSKVDKLAKQAIREQQKRIKPGECEKFLRLVIDSNVLQTEIGSELLPELASAQIKYLTRRLPVANCIIWERNVGQLTLDINTADLCEEWKEQNQVVRIVTVNELQQALKTSNLMEYGTILRNAFPMLKHTIIMPRPKDKQGQLLNALIELQVMFEINVIQTTFGAQELVTHLRRITKSIAEAPYKQQRSEIMGSFKNYLANDKKQCVRVENGNGYGRLWQQHLNRLPLVTLEVAESIIAQYPNPKKLLDHFERDPTAVATLADLKIMRNGPQPLKTDRRIGNVLAGKLYTLYSARNPNTQL